MTRTTAFAICLGGLLFMNCNPENPEPQDLSEDKLKALIADMTIEEKVGQMTQLNLDVISVGEVYNLKEPHELDMEKLRHALVDKHTGSILNVGGHAYSLEHWQEIITEIQKVATTKTRQRIPIIYGIDAIHGANYIMEGTLFPQPLAQAATWNPQQVKRCAEITAYETRASGVPWNFSPVLDLGRQPLWSRMFETYGEDVTLAKAMGNACIEGYQGEDASDPERVSACMKHFLGYSWSFSGKDRTPVYMHERQLRQYFLPTFEAAIDQGALSVMINSGELNGIPVHADYDILTKLLREELGYDGVAVTDWEDIMKLRDNHKVAATLKEAVKMAVMAGIDMSMTPNDYSFTDLLIELVKEGEVPESRLDESVYRILLMKQRLGLFEDPYYFDTHDYSLVGSKAHDDVNYATACQAITLLKNENNTLPLRTDMPEKILVTGPGANSLSLLNGAWSRTWQGTETKYDDESKYTVVEAMQDRLLDKVVHIESCSLDVLDEEGLESIKSRASEFTQIVVCLGELPATEIPGNIDDLTLEMAQLEMVKELSTLNLPMTAVLLFNRPRIISSIEPMLDAIVMAYNPGDEGGLAIADVLTGKVNPSGRLPITYPRHVNDLITYDHKYTEQFDNDFSKNAYDPQYPFGHGLSYSTVSYSGLKLSTDTLEIGQDLTVTISVKNESKTYDHDEVIMLFVNDRVASITPSVRKLRAFDRVSIPKGAAKEVSLTISSDDLKFVGQDLTWIAEEGWFEVEVGGMKTELYLKND
ncbi:MAG: glycoside hydrolase family 3 C-terminal domain-containing protein [Bacteroidetes bacterium]|nr:glycoside hydrolase family 3 C-terminal domain-containing protein [Bacteroidota bacterium]